MHYKISIVMPSFNQGAFLEEAILSIIHQDYDNKEIIIMDGGSTDNSVDIIKKYEKHITYWKSEKDNGQSAALNEGFRIASGDILTWLNSDDILLPNTLRKVDEIVQLHPDIRFYLGNVIWMDKDRKIIKAFKVERYSRFFVNKGLMANGGPTAFFYKSLLDDYGYLKENFHYMMDTELWRRWIHHDEKFFRLPFFCWGLRLHENAKMSGHNFKNSVLADRNHPSWKQKEKERDAITKLYKFHHNKFDMIMYSIFKLLDKSIISRVYFVFFNKKVLTI